MRTLTRIPALFAPLWTVFILVMVMGISACAQLGLTAPQSLEDRVQYGKATVSAAYRTVGDQVASKQLTSDKGQAYFARLDQAEKQVTLAESLMKNGKPTDAMMTINLALAALVAIKGELEAKKP
jgi:hypothetical protein